jgi:DNA invertase Pin-like site-specific DNA recombinase
MLHDLLALLATDLIPLQPLPLQV